MLAQFSGLIWFVVTLLPLVLLQRLLHREIQAVALILTRNPQLTVTIFSVLFLPGVFLHEISHYVVALLVGVSAARFSLIPELLPDGRLQLGYVETVRTDILRDSLIGAAPLFAGSLFVAFIAVDRLHLLPLWEVLRNGQFDLFWLGITLLPRIRDFPLWFYLAFTVSSTMMPSQSDRHAWLPLGLAIAVLLALAVVAGAGGWMLANLAPPLDQFLRSLAVVFGLSAGVHAVLTLLFALAHRVLTRLTHVDVE